MAALPHAPTLGGAPFSMRWWVAAPGLIMLCGVSQAIVYNSVLPAEQRIHTHNVVRARSRRCVRARNRRCAGARTCSTGGWRHATDGSACRPSVQGKEALRRPRLRADRLPPWWVPVYRGLRIHQPSAASHASSAIRGRHCATASSCAACRGESQGGKLALPNEAAAAGRR